MYAQIREKMRVNTHSFTMITAGLLLAFAVGGFLITTSTVFAQADAIHNPGFVSGNISLGDTSKNTVTPVSPLVVLADGTDASDKVLHTEATLNQVLGTYTLDVHIPDKNIQNYNVGCRVYYSSDQFQYFAFKLQPATVHFNNQSDPDIVNLELNPGYISGQIAPKDCVLKGGWIMAVPGDRTYDSYGGWVRNVEETRIRFGADGNFHFPVTPNQNIRVWGQYELEGGWIFDLEPKNISVAQGQEVNPAWEIKSCEPGCHGKLSGVINLQGSTNGGYKIWLDGATKGYMFSSDGKYVFDNLNPGTHYLKVQVLFTGDDFFLLPYADYFDLNLWKSGMEIPIPCGETIKNITPYAAFVNGKIIFPKGRTVVQFENEQDPDDPKLSVTYAEFTSLGLNGAGGWSIHRNGGSVDVIDSKSGNYDLILTEGTWRVHGTHFKFTNYRKFLCDKPNDTYNEPQYIDLAIAEYSREGKETVVSLGAGEVKNDNNFEFETGSVTVKFYISGGGTFDKPHLSATLRRIENSDTIIDSGSSSDGIMTNAEKTEGEATVIGIPGNYTIKASATVNGVSTSFGEINVDIKAGICNRIELGAPTLNVEVQTTCGNESALSGKAWDDSGITSIAVTVNGEPVNGEPVTFTPTGNTDPKFPNEVSFSKVITLQEGVNTVKTEATNVYNKTASETRTLYTYKAGVFTVIDDNGEVKIDWLYDGGMYRGEFGIFSLTGMENFAPNSPDFIKEAARRALSNTSEGYKVFSDITEGARFSGQLGSSKEPERNFGTYKGIKTCIMKPGDSFATIFVPNSTLQSVFDDPATTDRNKVPIFSLALSNPDHKMYLGQFAKIADKENPDVPIENAFAFEDIIFENSDRDYNDIIVQFKGVSVCAPTLDNPELGFTNDWRKSPNPVIPHIEVSPPGPETLWITVTLKSPADLFVYDPQGNVIGKEGGNIPGATFETDADGHQIVSLPKLDSGEYRVVLRAIGEGGLCHLEVKGYKGETELTAKELPFTIGVHETFATVISADAFTDSTVIDFGTPDVPVSVSGKILHYDFNGDGKIDDADIARVSEIWNTCKGNENYDPFFDLDNDGCITVKDIMKVSGGK